ncbi:MAG: helix-turn-helix transcriptional regulator [Oscillospiraceae bacterium]
MDNSILVENIIQTCKSKGIAPTNACRDSGVGTSFIPDIKRGRTPSVAKVQILADFLGVTTSELLGENKKPPVSGDNERLKELLANVDVKTREAIELLDQLSPDNLERAKEYIRFELARQGDSGDK